MKEKAGSKARKTMVKKFFALAMVFTMTASFSGYSISAEHWAAGTVSAWTEAGLAMPTEEFAGSFQQ